MGYLGEFTMFSRRHPILFSFYYFWLHDSRVSWVGGPDHIGVQCGGFRFQPGGCRRQHRHCGGYRTHTDLKTVIDQLKTFKEDDRIKAIILRVDSPGGGIGPSQEIYRELMKLRNHKKVVTSMGSVAASGGYYIAAATHGIVANPGTITGSIGVIMEYANLMEIAKKIGISPVVIKSGEFKDMGSPLRELREEEKKLFQDLVNELHSQFVSDAAAARNIKPETMAELADGRVYTGQTAVELKLVDRLGNLDDALEWAGELAGIQGKLVPVYPEEDKITFLKRLAETLFEDVNLKGAVSDYLEYSRIQPR